MGIRLYFRNKYKPENEYCLGKLFAYAEGNDKLKCVDFLNDVGVLDEFWLDGEIHTQWSYCETPQELFLDMCCCCTYQDYGEFFELCTEDLFMFLYLYRKDQKEFWRPQHIVTYDTDLLQEIKYVQKHASVENRWEFRLGA